MVGIEVSGPAGVVSTTGSCLHLGRWPPPRWTSGASHLFFPLPSPLPFPCCASSSFSSSFSSLSLSSSHSFICFGLTNHGVTGNCTECAWESPMTFPSAPIGKLELCLCLLRVLAGPEKLLRELMREGLTREERVSGVSVLQVTGVLMRNKDPNKCKT